MRKDDKKMREKGKKTEKPVRRLYTEEGLNLPEVPWNVYPRPQMRRDKWLCLNGEWSFSTQKPSN